MLAITIIFHYSFGASMSNLNIILKYCTKRFNTESELLEVCTQRDTHTLGSLN